VIELKFKRFSILFAMMLVLSSIFSSFAFADAAVKPKLVALGDSITYGWNLNPDKTPSTSAFPYLIGGGKFEVAANISFPGWRSDQLLDAAKKPESLAAIQQASVITLDIGNNDLLQNPVIAPVLANPSAVLTPEQLQAITNAVTETSGKVAANLTAIIGLVKTANPDAQIILYNMYNPFAAGTLHALGEQIVPAINKNVIEPIAAQSGSVLADAYSAMNGHQAELILPNDIHPNTEGHKALAQAGDKALAALAPKLELTPSTTDETTDPVTVTVTTAAKKVVAIKWLSGEKTVQDFATEGNDVTNGQFDVTENGTYTVYLLDSLGFEVVTTITIDNIKPAVEPQPTPEPTPQPEPTPTPTPVPTPVPTDNGDSGNPLPETATSAYNYVVIGFGTVLAGFAAFGVQQFRRRENQ
jgi:lysophospholipase L1-like esterase